MTDNYKTAKMKLFNNHYGFTIRFDKNEFLPWISYVGTKHWKSIVINTFCIEISIQIVVKDWMIRGTEIHSGKIYNVWSKNPKYKGEELSAIIFSRNIKEIFKPWKIY